MVGPVEHHQRVVVGELEEAVDQVEEELQEEGQPRLELGEELEGQVEQQQPVSVSPDALAPASLAPVSLSPAAPAAC